ncbi:MAG TPA: radical SAM protein [Vicinamibacteria bacterium]|nr:radical SAM protein [Vicinamibacteria bacterium]
MRVLLTLPFDARFRREAPDLGLGYLAACLRQQGHAVDLQLRPNRFPTAAAFGESVRRGCYDLCGVKVLSCQANAVAETVDTIRQVSPSTIVVAGGPQVSADPQSLFRLFPTVDYGLQGEAEQPLARLVRAVGSGTVGRPDLQHVPGLVFRDGAETVVNEPELRTDLDAVPFPAWDLMAPDSFPGIPFNGYSRRFPIAPMILTRGCPHRCTFCGAATVNGHRIRSRSADNVLEEIRLLTGRFGVRELQFCDSNCAHRTGPLREVLERMVRERIDVTWCAPNGIRLDSLDRDLAFLMKRSGCFQVNVGIESGSPRILKQIRKALSLDTVRKQVSLLREADIEVVGFFMLGFPGETRQEIEATAALAMSLPLTAASFSVYCPLPGTEDYDRLFPDGMADRDTLQSFDFWNWRNDLSEVPGPELVKLQKRAYWRFHARPRVLKHILKNLNSAAKLKAVTRRSFEILLSRSGGRHS